MADGQACSLNKNTTQYGRHFSFLARYIRLSVGASIFRFCFVYFVSSFHSNFWLPWRVFPYTFFSYYFQCVARTRRVGVGDATSSRTAAIASHAILRIGPFVRYFRFIYISKALEKNSNPMRECRQKAPKMRRCHRCGTFSMPIMRKLRD